MIQERGGALVPIHLDNAQADGALSDRARRLMEENARAITLSHGADSSKMNDNPLLVLILADNSGSMNQKRAPRSESMVRTEDDDPNSNAEVVRKCQNNTIDGLLKSPHPERIYLSTQVLNPIDRNPEHVVIDPYHPLAQAVRLNRQNFRAKGDTPLYDRVVQVFGTALYETQAAIDEWKEPRTATLIISDGGDLGSRHRAEDCAELAKSLLSSPTKRHILAAIGISDSLTDFRRIFLGMGIPDQWILTADATPEQIAAAINRFTQAASKAAEATQQQFLMLTDGGFKGITPQ